MALCSYRWLVNTDDNGYCTTTNIGYRTYMYSYKSMQKGIIYHLKFKLIIKICIIKRFVSVKYHLPIKCKQRQGNFFFSVFLMFSTFFETLIPYDLNNCMLWSFRTKTHPLLYSLASKVTSARQRCRFEAHWNKNSIVQKCLRISYIYLNES